MSIDELIKKGAVATFAAATVGLTAYSIANLPPAPPRPPLIRSFTPTDILYQDARLKEHYEISGTLRYDDVDGDGTKEPYTVRYIDSRSLLILFRDGLDKP